MAHVLLVDDDKSILDCLEVLLKESHYKVHSVTDAVKALNNLEANKYDLIISDFNMPFLNGIEFYREVKARGLETHFVLFSASDDILQDEIPYFEKASGMSHLMNYVKKNFEVKRENL